MAAFTVNADWQIRKYRPIAPTKENPEYNDGLGFHQDRSQVRVILGANRSGKSQAILAELAAVALGRPFPWWFNWDKENSPEPPLTIWLVVNQFPSNAAADARIKKLYFGERYLTRDKRWIWAGAFIPEAAIAKRSPDWSEVVLKNGTTISVKSSEQKVLAFASANVDLIVVDEPTTSEIWGEIVSRLVAAPYSRIIHGLTDIYDTTDYLDSILENIDNGLDAARFDFTTAGNPHTDRTHAEKTFKLQSREARLVREMGMRKSEVLRCYPKIERWIDEGTLQVVKNFQGGTGNFIRPFAIPKNWTRYVVHDPGVKLAAAVWFAVEPGTNDIYAYRAVVLNNPGGNVNRVCEIMNRANNGDEIQRWYMDPKAAKHTPRTYVYAATKSTIDVYQRNSEKYGIRWSMGPPSLENYARVSRINALTAYLDPQDKSTPMMYFFDVKDGLDPDKGIGGMQELKYQFRKYKYDPKNREKPMKGNDDGPYCCEAAAVIGLRWRPNTMTGGRIIRNPYNPLDDFKNGMPEGWREEP